MSFQTSEILLLAAQWCGDYAQRVYTVTKTLPCAQQAMRDLQDSLEDNDIAFIKKRSAIIAVPISVPVSAVPLPNDFWDPIELWERPSGGTEDQLTEVDKVEFITDLNQYSEILEWEYNEGAIHVNPINTAREVRLYYNAGLIIPPSASTVIPEDEYKSYLGFRAGAIAAITIGENETRAKFLDHEATIALGALLRTGVKNNQEFVTRRQPYRGLTRARRGRMI